MFKANYIMDIGIIHTAYKEKFRFVRKLRIIDELSIMRTRNVEISLYYNTKDGVRSVVCEADNAILALVEILRTFDLDVTSTDGKIVVNDVTIAVEDQTVQCFSNVINYCLLECGPDYVH